MSERWVQTVITGWGTALAGEGGCSLQGLMTSPGAAAVEAAGETAKQTEQNWIYAIWKKKSTSTSSKSQHPMTKYKRNTVGAFQSDEIIQTGGSWKNCSWGVACGMSIYKINKLAKIFQEIRQVFLENNPPKFGTWSHDRIKSLTVPKADDNASMLATYYLC